MTDGAACDQCLLGENAIYHLRKREHNGFFPPLPSGDVLKNKKLLANLDLVAASSCSAAFCGGAESPSFRRLWTEYWRDSPDFTRRLKEFIPRPIFPVHDGCVNTVVWSPDGRYLLSGSDDQYLVITDPFTNSDSTVVARIQSGHRSNIFSAKFLPCTDNKQIVSCSSDGSVILTDVEREETHGKQIFNCHTSNTYEVGVIANDPYTFLSCGEDGHVRWFDRRQKTHCIPCIDDVILDCQRSVCALDVHPYRTYLLVVGCSDSTARLFDMRMLSKPNTDTSGLLGLKSVFIHPLLKDASDRNKRITSLDFSPDGENVLVSFSSDFVYLYSLNEFSSDPVQFNEENDSGEDRTPVKRVRLRGDWSDTGPSARPEQQLRDIVERESAEGSRSTSERQAGEEGGAATAGEQEPMEEARRARPMNIMQRFSCMLTRWFERQMTGEDDENDSSPEEAENQPSPASQEELQQPHDHQQPVGDEEGAMEDRESTSAMDTCSESGLETENLAETAQRDWEEVEPCGGSGLETENLAETAQRDWEKGEPCGGSGLETENLAGTAQRDWEKVEPCGGSGLEKENLAGTAQRDWEEVESCGGSGLEKENLAGTAQRDWEEVESCGGSGLEKEKLAETAQRDWVKGEDVESCGGSGLEKEKLAETGTGRHREGKQEVAGKTEGESQETEAAGKEKEEKQTARSDGVGLSEERVERIMAECSSQMDVRVHLATQGTVCSTMRVVFEPTVDEECGRTAAMESTRSESEIQETGDVEGSRLAEISGREEALVEQQQQSSTSTAEASEPLQIMVEQRGIEADEATVREELEEIESERETRRRRLVLAMEAEAKRRRERKLELAKAIQKFPQHKCLGMYRGHRNARTMLKQACFWGKNHVMSGSDCGHFFVWNRHNAKVEMAIEADRHVVNCLQPHPTLPILATSGIDYNIKLWAPIAEECTIDEQKLKDLIKRNDQMLAETKDTVTIPAAFMIRMIANMNRVRNERRRRQLQERAAAERESPSGNQ